MRWGRYRSDVTRDPAPIAEVCYTFHGEGGPRTKPYPTLIDPGSATNVLNHVLVEMLDPLPLTPDEAAGFRSYGGRGVRWIAGATGDPYRSVLYMLDVEVNGWRKEKVLFATFPPTVHKPYAILGREFLREFVTVFQGRGEERGTEQMLYVVDSENTVVRLALGACRRLSKRFRGAGGEC